MSRADWLVKLLTSVLFTTKQLEYYLTVLVYTKTTIHLSVGG